MELGKTQTLKIERMSEHGAYLGDGEKGGEVVLLPKKYIPDGAFVGESVEVFIYKDSEDRLVAVTTKPDIELGEMAVLQVADVASIGAFLEWGLEKDLFLPFKEQTQKLKKGDKCLVSLYIDKSQRLCATMKIYERLRSDSEYQRDDQVTGVVYGIREGLGALVAVDLQYHGMIPERELHRNVKVGDEIKARVTRVREDGKLCLSIQEKAYRQLEIDSQTVLARIDWYGGRLPFNDKAAPERISQELKMSKAAFKRAVGHLLKEGMIEIKEDGIYRRNKETGKAD